MPERALARSGFALFQGGGPAVREQVQRNKRPLKLRTQRGQRHGVSSRYEICSKNCYKISSKSRRIGMTDNEGGISSINSGRRPVMALLELLERKWALRILWELRDGALNSRALRHAAGDISPSVLQARVDELRDAGLIELGSQGYSLIAPLEKPYPDDIQAAFDKIMGAGVPPLVLFTTLASSERAWRKFSTGSLLDGRLLTLRQRELVIDRVCARAGCEYEWGVHVMAFARASGLTREEITGTLEYPLHTEDWTDDEAALLETDDALHDRATLASEEFERIRKHFDEHQVLEILMLAGFLPHGFLHREWPRSAAGTRCSEIQRIPAIGDCT